MAKDTMLAVINGLSEGLVKGLQIREERRFRNEELLLKQKQLDLEDKIKNAQNSFDVETLQLKFENLRQKIEMTELEREAKAAGIKKTTAETTRIGTQVATDLAESITKVSAQQSKEEELLTDLERSHRAAMQSGMQEKATQLQEQIDRSKARIQEFDKVRQSLTNKNKRSQEKATGARQTSQAYDKAIGGLSNLRSKAQIADYLKGLRGLSPEEEDEVIKKAKAQTSEP